MLPYVFIQKLSGLKSENEEKDTNISTVIFTIVL